MIEMLTTPVEQYRIGKQQVWVKREDLATPPPGPPFSKVRGLVPTLIRLKAEGYTHIGYVETSVSMAGWGVAWACAELGLTSVIFDPQYKTTPELLDHHRRQWAKFNAITIPQQAGMAKVNWNIARKLLAEKYERSYLLPLGLPFPETIDAAAAEIKACLATTSVRFSTIIVNVGSGTVCAGLLRGVSGQKVIGVMGRTGDMQRKVEVIRKKSGMMLGGMWGVDFSIVDPGWEYTQPCERPVPFPCHRYYDAKAWAWLEDNIEKLIHPILFWNIGQEGDRK